MAFALEDKGNGKFRISKTKNRIFVSQHIYIKKGVYAELCNVLIFINLGGSVFLWSGTTRHPVGVASLGRPRRLNGRCFRYALTAPCSPPRPICSDGDGVS